MNIAFSVLAKTNKTHKTPAYAPIFMSLEKVVDTPDWIWMSSFFTLFHL